MELPEIQQAISKEKMLRMKVKEKQAAQRQIDIDTDSFRLKDQEEFDKDVYYVDHITFLGDWKIIFQTVKTVLTKEGISSETAATMETFHGSQNKETENI